MRFAYADPPYLGCGARHYGHQHAEASVWDSLDAHRDLLARLEADFPDGWAYSLTSGTLFDIGPFVPRPVRVLAWVKPFASFKPRVRLAYAWEPIILRGGRRTKTREELTVRDWHSAMPPVFQGKHNRAKNTRGEKPQTFCFWLFEAFGMQDGDEMTDIFPGSGAVTDALDSWRRQRRFA